MDTHPIPQEAQAQLAQGNALAQEGKLDAARACYDRAVALAPGFAAAYNNRGNLFARARRFAEAYDDYARATALDPANALYASNGGAMLYQLKRYDEALACYDRAIAGDAAHLNAYINRGQLLADIGRVAEAEASFDAALALDPESVPAHWNKALLRLLMGDYAEGWALYEWRWRKQPFLGNLRDYPQPLWLGDADITGRTLLVHPEQGLGDFIQFVRYVPLLVAKGIRVVVEAPVPLVPLLASLPGGAVIVPQGEPLPAFDYHCPVMSLPLACGTLLTTVPADVPYLAAPPEAVARWKQRLGTRQKPRIGLVWSGAATHVNDHNRSMPLAALAPLLAMDAEFHTLQLDVREADRPHLGAIRFHGGDLRDFGDSAALVAEMDIVVTVDTAVAHLAGALGKRVWLLVAYAPDFRWLLARDDSPWYPTMRIFRQTQAGAWGDVVARVVDALRAEGVATGAADPHAALVGEAFTQALAAHQAGELAMAEALYNEILKIDARHVPSMVNLGTLYLASGRLEDALMTAEQGLGIDEAQPMLHYIYGRVLMEARMPEEAVRRYGRAVELAPDTAEFHSARGNACFALNRYADAAESYDAAIAREPGSAEYYNNRGNARAHMMRVDDAIADYAQAVALAPGMADADYNRALLELMQGNFAQGWQRHESRWERPFFAADRRTLAAPLWLGEGALTGKTILIYAEQGLGDVIQFARYVPLLEAMGAQVVLEVHAPLVGLMRTLGPAVTVVARHEALPPYDLQCPVMSLPLAFRTMLETIPAQVPYLSVPPAARERWQQLLGPKLRKRVGLAWSGSATHQNDHNRSIPLAQLAPLLALPYEFHALQPELRDSDRPAMSGLRWHGKDIRDFSDTAALAEAMDVVVSVDTSVAHLAGALGRPLCVLLPFVPDFRWLLARGDSPWYPTAQLFRQQTAGDWAPVVAQLVDRLARD